MCPFFYNCVKGGELVTMLCGVHVRVCSMCGFIKAEETVKLCIPVNMLDPICTRYRSAQKRWPEVGTLACFWARLIWPNPDTVSLKPNWICAGYE